MADGAALAADARPPFVFGGSEAGDPPIVLGLINNMPDAALAATEVQFRTLIADAAVAAGGQAVRLKLFRLPGVPRSEAAEASMARRYLSTDSLPASPVDALIVTGAEPVAADLVDEPFWAELAALTEWAERNTVSTLFSCLAAHAAVRRLDGIIRTPLPEKCGGVFAVTPVAHALTQKQGEMLVPHSRWNTLSEHALTRRGYQVLSRGDGVGVDAFVRDRDSLFLFLQGHPEYDADSLMLEYRRDLRRFLTGQQGAHPRPPQGYFAPQVEAQLAALAAETARAPHLSALSECARIMRLDPPRARWAKTTAQLYANWLGLIAERVRARATA